MVYIDYTNSILQYYESKRNKNELSLRLSLPSPAELRDECEAVFLERYDPKDDITLKTFFGAYKDKQSGLRAIEHHSIDKFKPLVRYLKKETKDTQHKNIELLAWLIDFKPRPFDYWIKVGTTSIKDA